MLIFIFSSELQALYSGFALIICTLKNFLAAHTVLELRSAMGKLRHRVHMRGPLSPPILEGVILIVSLKIAVFHSYFVFRVILNKERHAVRLQIHIFCLHIFYYFCSFSIEIKEHVFCTSHDVYFSPMGWITKTLDPSALAPLSKFRIVAN